MLDGAHRDSGEPYLPLAGTIAGWLYVASFRNAELRNGSADVRSRVHDCGCVE